MDLSKLSTEDLVALKSGDLTKVSDEGLMALKEMSQPKPGLGNARDFISGINKTIGGTVDALLTGYNLLLPKSQEVQPLSQGFRDVGIDVDRPRSLLGMAGEYAMPSPGGAKANAIQTGLAATGGYLARQMFPDSPWAEMAGAVLAPETARVAPAAVAEGTRRLVRGGDPTAMRQNIAIADKIGAPTSIGAASGNEVVAAVEKMSGSIPGGVTPFRRAGEQAAEAMKARLTTIAGGQADDIAKAGSVLNKGLFDDVSGWTARTKATRDTLYRKLDDKIRKDWVGNPKPDDFYALSTRQFIANVPKGLPGAPSLSASLFGDPTSGMHFDGYFSKFIEDLDAGDGKIPYEAIKRVRTEIGDMLGDPQLIGSTRRSLLKEFYSSLTDDLRRAAEDSGALKEFERANRYHKARIERIEDFYTTLNKKVAPEDVWSAVIGDTPKSATRLNAVKKALKPAEWNYVRQTLITRMGRPVASAAVEDGVDFSAQTFLTNYERMKKNGALTEVFGTGQYRKDIEEVAKYASNLRQSAAVMANPSGTAALGLGSSALFGALGMAAGLAAGGTPVGLVSIGGATLANSQISRLLNNQRFVRWLAQSTKIPPGSMPDHVKRLAIIANNDPALLEDAQAFLTAASAIGQ